MIRLDNISASTLSTCVELMEKVKQKGRKGDILKQGIIGEALAFEVLNFAHDGDVQMTDNWFDSEKDGTVAGETYEVKTIFPFWKQRVFSIEHSQFNKIMSVDRLIIVQVPAADEDTVLIHEIPQDKRWEHTIVDTDYSKVINYPFTSLTPYGIIENKTISNTLSSFHPTAKSWYKYGSI